MKSFTPKEKNNMVGWMAGRSDGANYGQVIVFNFPKEKLVFGPMQIEARIDQDPEIAKSFTLWDQIGTRVVRGNLLVIPIEESLLYVEPIYLRAEQEGSLPELKRVIVSYGGRITMEETLDKAISVIFGAAAEKPADDAAVRITGELASDALLYYTKAQERLAAGDWAGYGSELEQMRGVLSELAKREG